MKKEKLGEIIQRRRETLSVKQEDLAEMSGITAKTIYLIEQGKGNPSIDTLLKIMEVLGLDISLHVKKIEV
jgi:transcriptional regulator with XRE-family HTH domain